MKWYERIRYFFRPKRVEEYRHGKQGQFVCHATGVDVIFKSRDAAELYDLYGIRGFSLAIKRGFAL